MKKRSRFSSQDVLLPRGAYKKLSREHKSHGRKILDPRDNFLQVWNRILYISCFFAVSCDPIMFYVGYMDDQNQCSGVQTDTAIISTTVRTFLDMFYVIRMFFEYRTAFFAPSQESVLDDLVYDPDQIAKHYLKGRFVVDILSVLPLPQLVVWGYLFEKMGVFESRKALLVIVLVQYFPRFLRMFSLASEIRAMSGVFVKASLAGAMYYLLLFMLSSHIVGSCWYLLALQRNTGCWEKACKTHPNLCKSEFLYCTNDNELNSFPTEWKIIRDSFFAKECSVENDEIPSEDVVKFGIYKQSLQSGTFSKNKFLSKYMYCLWWGMRNLSSLGQGLDTSTSSGEVYFSISVLVLGVLFSALLIAKVQIYLQSIGRIIEEMRLKWRDSEHWMQLRVLPDKLKERVRRYNEYIWTETGGVDEDEMVQSLPKNLRLEVKRHLCLSYVKGVPLFAKMDDQLLDTICLMLKPCFFTKESIVVYEGDPVEQILLIINGKLKSETTDGGRRGFYNQRLLRDGDLFGDELLTWSLDPNSRGIFPSSAQTARALTEVEAFALSAEDMMFVASQFRQLQTSLAKHMFRFYSQQWRTWAAYFIQSAWRRYTKQMAKEDVSRVGSSARHLIQLQRPPEPRFHTQPC